MKILFVMLRPGYVETYASVLELLAERGHAIHLAFSMPAKAAGELDLAERLAARHEGITFGPAASRAAEDGWYPVAAAVRLYAAISAATSTRASTTRRPCEPGGARTSSARRSRGRRIPGSVGRAGAAAVGVLSHRSSRLLAGSIARLTALLESAIPVSRRVEADVRRSRAGLVLATPVVAFGSDQVEYLKAARRLGLPTGVCVASWDNLTNKGVLRFQPERVFVWNEIQRREATDQHGVRPGSVVATGAPRFDEWFARRPSRDAEELRGTARLDLERPHLVYLCSSGIRAPAETSFVRGWGAAIRSSGIRELEEIDALIRPHPQNAAQKEAFDLDDIGNAALWPRAGASSTTSRPAPTSTTRSPRRCRGRREHERPDRGVHHRKGRLHGSRPRFRGHPARHAPLPLPAAAERRVPPRSRLPPRARAAASLRPARGGRRGEETSALPRPSSGRTGSAPATAFAEAIERLAQTTVSRP